MSSILGGGDQEIIQQVTGGAGGAAGFLKKLGSVGQSFTGGNKKDKDALIDDFIQQLLGDQGEVSSSSSPVAPAETGQTLQQIISSQPVTSGSFDPGLGSVADRLLKGRAQGGGSPSIGVPPLVLPPMLGGPGGGIGGGAFTPQLPLNLFLNSQPKIPPIFSRQPF